MERLLSDPLTYGLGALLVLALLLFLLAIWQLRVGRKGPYWRMRRAAGQRGGQLFLVSISLFGLVTVVGFLSGLAQIALGEVLIPEETAEVIEFTPTPTPNIDGTIAAAIDGTLTAMAANPTATPATRVAAVMTPTPSPTVTATPLPGIAFIPEKSTVVPRPNSQIDILTVIDRFDLAGDEARQFAPGITRLIVPVTFNNMVDGVTWSRALYRDGVPVQAGSYRWSEGTSGETLFFFGDERGYLPGTYQIRLYVGTVEIDRYQLTIGKPE